MSISLQKSTEMIRINVDETDIEYIGGPTVTWKGEPFTGITFEQENDQILNEVTYLNGIENGLEKSWYPNGKLESVGENRWNRPHGSFKTWYQSGQLKNEGLTELGHVIWRKEWDEEGNQVSEYKIEEYPDRLESLKLARETAKNYGFV